MKTRECTLESDQTPWAGTDVEARHDEMLHSLDWRCRVDGRWGHATAGLLVPKARRGVCRITLYEAKPRGEGFGEAGLPYLFRYAATHGCTALEGSVAPGAPKSFWDYMGGRVLEEPNWGDDADEGRPLRPDYEMRIDLE